VATHFSSHTKVAIRKKRGKLLKGRGSGGNRGVGGGKERDIDFILFL